MFSLKYKKRQRFFSSLIMLAEKLDVEINYSRERLKILIEDFDEKQKKNLLGLDANYLKYLSGEVEFNNENLFKNLSILRPSEKDLIFIFFKSLGRTDVVNQSKEIKSYVKRFEEYSKSSDIENKKFGSLCTKLGVVVGLLLVVLLI
jgi:stage III sporulation protein AB